MPTNPSRVAEVQALAESLRGQAVQSRLHFVERGHARLAADLLDQFAAHLAQAAAQEQRIVSGPNASLDQQDADLFYMGQEVRRLRKEGDQLQAQADRQAQELAEMTKDRDYALAREADMARWLDTRTAERDRQAQTLKLVRLFSREQLPPQYQTLLDKLLADGGASVAE